MGFFTAFFQISFQTFLQYFFNSGFGFLSCFKWSIYNFRTIFCFVSWAVIVIKYLGFLFAESGQLVVILTCVIGGVVVIVAITMISLLCQRKAKKPDCKLHILFTSHYLHIRVSPTYTVLHGRQFCVGGIPTYLSIAYGYTSNDNVLLKLKHKWQLEERSKGNAVIFSNYNVNTTHFPTHSSFQYKYNIKHRDWRLRENMEEYLFDKCKQINNAT